MNTANGKAYAIFAVVQIHLPTNSSRCVSYSIYISLFQRTEQQFVTVVVSVENSFTLCFNSV